MPDFSRSNEFLNPAVLRFLTHPPDEVAGNVLSSPRYNGYSENINRPVIHPKFSGYWVLQHSLKNPRAPSNSDLTILYFHGGGYLCNRPAHYLLFLLQLAESILDQNVSVSIFALDYSLAPEHTFPTQLREAAAAYEYLIDKEKVLAEKVVVAGDSAGGHLALSLLVDLDMKQSLSADKQAYQKPGGLALISPCLSLHHKPPSFTRNRHPDILSGQFIRQVVRRFLGRDVVAPGTQKDADVNSPNLEFLFPDPQIGWKDVLPSWVWISVGKNEIFSDFLTI